MDELVLIRKAPKKLSPFVRPKVLSQVVAVNEFVTRWLKAEEAQRGQEVADIIANLVLSPLAHLTDLDSVYDVQHLMVQGPLQWVETLYSTWPFPGLAQREDPDNSSALLIAAAQDVQLSISTTYEQSTDAWRRLRQLLDFGLGPILNLR